MSTVLEAAVRLIELSKAASEGPWFYGYWSGQCHLNHLHGRDVCKYDMEKCENQGTDMCSEGFGGRGVTVFSTTDEYIAMDKADGQLIAHSRNEIERVCEALVEAVSALDLIGNMQADEGTVDKIVANGIQRGLVAREALRRIKGYEE